MPFHEHCASDDNALVMFRAEPICLISQWVSETKSAQSAHNLNSTPDATTAADRANKMISAIADHPRQGVRLLRGCVRVGRDALRDDQRRVPVPGPDRRLGNRCSTVHFTRSHFGVCLRCKTRDARNFTVYSPPFNDICGSAHVNLLPS